MTGATHKADLLPDSWQVQLPVFEGPLDLLLHLVRINEVEVRDIPVARVCDQFHAYLGLMEELNLDIAAEYIYEAALLIYLKSRLLLPLSGCRSLPLRTPGHVVPTISSASAVCAPG